MVALSQLVDADRDDFDRLDATDQRMAAGIIDVNSHQLSRLASISVKHDDAITIRATGHLHDRVRRIRLLTFLARPFDQDFNDLPDQLGIIFFGNCVLDCQQFVIASALSPRAVHHLPNARTLSCPDARCIGR